MPYFGIKLNPPPQMTIADTNIENQIGISVMIKINVLLARENIPNPEVQTNNLKSILKNNNILLERFIQKLKE